MGEALEGSQATDFRDLLVLREAVKYLGAGGHPDPDRSAVDGGGRPDLGRPPIREVLNDVTVAERAFALLEQRPIGTELLNELHAVLVHDVGDDVGSVGRLRDPLHPACFQAPVWLPAGIVEAWLSQKGRDDGPSPCGSAA